MTILLKTYKRLETNQYLKLVKFIRYYFRKKPLTQKQIEELHRIEKEVIQNLSDSIDTDLDYLDYVCEIKSDNPKKI